MDQTTLNFPITYRNLLVSGVEESLLQSAKNLGIYLKYEGYKGIFSTTLNVTVRGEQKKLDRLIQHYQNIF